MIRDSRERRLNIRLSERDKSSYRELLLRIISFVAGEHERVLLVITRQPTNRIFKCVIAAKLKGRGRQFRGAKAVTQFSMYVAKISLAAKIQSNTLAKHYLRVLYIYYS